MSISPIFLNLFEVFGRLPSAHAEEVNRKAYEKLHAILAVPLEQEGRFILLKAPRAGHGKTHLLARVQHHLAGGLIFIPLHAAGGSRINAMTVTEDLLRVLLRPLPAGSGLCELDLLSRRLFALALQPLVASGEVPCQDRDGALAALRNRPVETFDFHHASAVTAQWAKEHFDILGPRLALELAERGALPIRGVGFWINALFQFASTPPVEAERLKILADTVSAGAESGGDSMERLQALAGLLTLLQRIIFVADELEGFSADPEAALRFTAFAGALRQAAGRLDILVSLNEDIWRTAFVPRLSGGLLDRLSETVVELEPLQKKEITALLESRFPGRGAEQAGRIDLEKSGSHARGVLRAASRLDEDDSFLKNHPEPPIGFQAPPEVAAAVAAAISADDEVSEIPVDEEKRENTISIHGGEIPARVEVAATELDGLAAGIPATEEFFPSISAPLADVSNHEAFTPLEPAPVMATVATEEPAELAGAATTAGFSAPDEDRVDELLRQFRERYGRSGS